MKSTIGDRIRVLRLIKNLSQENMANELNISVASYSNIERDVTDITVTRLLLIAEILQVRPSDILEMDRAQIIAESESRDYKAQMNVENEVEKLKTLINKLSKEIDLLKTKSKPTSKSKK